MLLESMPLTFWFNNFICAESSSTQLEAKFGFISASPNKPYSLALLMAA